MGSPIARILLDGLARRDKAFFVAPEREAGRGQALRPQEKQAVIRAETERPIELLESGLEVSPHAVHESQRAPGKGRAGVQSRRIPGVHESLIVLARKPEECKSVDGLRDVVIAVPFNAPP